MHLTPKQIADALRRLADEYEAHAAGLQKIGADALPLLRVSFPPDADGARLVLVCGAEWAGEED